jgi:hypothetical protein
MRSRTRSINWTTPSPTRSLWKASSGSSRGSSADPQSYLDYYIYKNICLLYMYTDITWIFDCWPVSHCHCCNIMFRFWHEDKT